METHEEVVPLLVEKLRQVFSGTIQDEGLFYDLADVMTATIAKHGYRIVHTSRVETEDGSMFFDMENQP